MADSGTFKNWKDGQPHGTVEVTANKSGSFKYWFGGQPWGTEYAAAAGGSQIKSLNGLAIASVKSRNGLAIASIKSINGLSNV